jgi:hypothetical protein
VDTRALTKEADGLTSESLRQWLDYDAETGVFTWRRSAGKARIGAVAGTVTRFGYLSICVKGRRHVAHRLAWLYVRGEWPSSEVDHIDTDKLNNRIANLRLCTNATNQQNRRGPPSNNTSGHIGVSWARGIRKWKATICVAGRTHFLGSFEKVEDAAKAYAEGKARLHRFHPTTRG